MNLSTLHITAQITDSSQVPVDEAADRWFKVLLHPYMTGSIRQDKLEVTVGRSTVGWGLEVRIEGNNTSHMEIKCLMF